MYYATTAAHKQFFCNACVYFELKMNLYWAGENVVGNKSKSKL